MLDFVLETLFGTGEYYLAVAPFLAMLPSVASQLYGMGQQKKLRQDLEKKQAEAQTEFDTRVGNIRGIDFSPSALNSA